MNVSLVISWVVALHGAGPAPSQAMLVHVRDLDLRSEAGSAMALQRIRDAAKAFCAEQPDRELQGMDVTNLNCRHDMARRAVAQLSSAQVKELYLDSLTNAPSAAH